jgi:hypothetical protein
VLDLTEWSEVSQKLDSERSVGSVQGKLAGAAS